MALEQENISADSILQRHVLGDWGDVSDVDKKSNDLALLPRLFGEKHGVVCASVVFSAWVPKTAKIVTNYFELSGLTTTQLWYRNKTVLGRPKGTVAMTPRGRQKGRVPRPFTSATRRTPWRRFSCVHFCSLDGLVSISWKERYSSPLLSSDATL